MNRYLRNQISTTSKNGRSMFYLWFDEMKIKEDLVYDKRTGELTLEGLQMTGTYTIIAIGSQFSSSFQQALDLPLHHPPVLPLTCNYCSNKCTLMKTNICMWMPMA